MSKIPEKRRSFDEMVAVVADFEASGFTQKTFAEHRQIPIATFSYWLRKVRNPTNASTTAKFLAVELVPPNGWILRRTQPPQSVRESVSGHLRFGGS